MGIAIQLRSDYSADRLRRLARASRDAAQTRRLLALAAIYEGGSRTMAARIAGVGLQIIRDWVVRFNDHGPDGLLDRKAPGKTRLLDDAQRSALARTVEAGPKPYLDGVVRWRLIDLAQWLREEFGVSVSRQTLGRELRVMGFRKLSARPRHYAQDTEVIEDFKKLSRPTGGDPAAARAWRGDRDLVPRRGPDRTEEQNNPQMGAARNPATRTTRSTHEMGLHFRRHLSGKRKKRRPRHALLRHPGHAGASDRDQRRS